MTKFNGHKNWNHWNVSLWILNDEGLYRMALEFAKDSRAICTGSDAKTLAANRMLHRLHSDGTAKTPDGARYSKTTIRAAMADL